MSKRKTVPIDTDLASDLEQISEQVGATNTAQLTRMGLRYVFGKIKSGDLVNINGHLVPKVDASEAAK